VSFFWVRSLTMIHMGFCSTIAFILIRMLGVADLPSNMTFNIYLTSVVPIGALYALSLWFSNSAYIYLSVSFIQVTAWHTAAFAQRN